VTIKGAVRGGADNTAVFTLPEGYRPTENRRFPGRAYEGGYTSHQIVVHNNGSVQIQGVSGTTGERNIEVSFATDQTTFPTGPAGPSGPAGPAGPEGVSPGEANIHEDDFSVDRRAALWRVEADAGVQSVSGGSLRAAQTGENVLFYKPAVMTDGVVDIEFTMEAGGANVPDLRALFRRVSTGNFAFSRIAGTRASPIIELWRQTNGANNNLWTRTTFESPKTLPIPDRASYWFRTIFDGTFYRVQLWDIDPDEATTEIPLIQVMANTTTDAKQESHGEVGICWNSAGVAAREIRTFRARPLRDPSVVVVAETLADGIEDNFDILDTTKWAGGTPADFEVVGGALRLTAAAAASGEHYLWRTDKMFKDFRIDARVRADAIVSLYIGRQHTDRILPYANYNYSAGANAQIYIVNNGGSQQPSIGAVGPTSADVPPDGTLRYWRFEKRGDRLEWRTYATDPDDPNVVPTVLHRFAGNLALDMRIGGGVPVFVGLMLQASQIAAFEHFKVTPLVP